MLMLFKLLWNYAQKAVKKYLPWCSIYYNIRIMYAHSHGMVVEWKRNLVAHGDAREEK